MSASIHLSFTPSSTLDQTLSLVDWISHAGLLPSNVSDARPLGSGIDVGIWPMNTPVLAPVSVSVTASRTSPPVVLTDTVTVSGASDTSRSRSLTCT